MAVEILNRVMTAVMAVANQGVNGWVGVVEVTTIRIRAAITGSVDRLLATTPALELRIREHCLGNCSRRYTGGLPAKGAIVRGAWPQRPRATASGLRRCWMVAEVGQFDQQAQEQKHQKQDEQGVKAIWRHGVLATVRDIARVPEFW